MKLAATAAALMLAAGQSTSLAQELCVVELGGCWSVISARTDAVNLCPSVAIAGSTAQDMRMIFAWGSASIEFHHGSATIARSPAQGDLPAQIFVRRYDADCEPLESAQPIVDYTSSLSWGHQYPSLAAQPGSITSFSGPSVDVPVVLTFASDFSGFSKVLPSADSRVIYVSEDGDDNNDGYSPHRPKETYAAGYGLVRNHFPDHLLLKRGDVFSHTSQVTWNRLGRSTQEPVLLGAYGVGARPTIDWPNAGHQEFVLRMHLGSSNPISYSRIHGLAITASNYTTPASRGPDGLSVLADGTDLRVEDCHFTKLGAGANLQGWPNNRTGSIVRRCIFWNLVRSASNNGGNGLWQGEYADSIVEDCFFGLSPAASGHCSHGLYNSVGDPDSHAARGCIAFNMGYDAIAARAGGLVERSVAIRSACGFQLGYCNPVPENAVGILRHNLVMEGRDWQDGNWGPWAYRINGQRKATLEENIAAHGTPYCPNTQTGGRAHNAVHVERCTQYLPVISSLEMTGNIAHNWLNSGSTETVNLQGLLGNATVTVEFNEFVQPGNARLVQVEDFDLPQNGVEFEANAYYSNRQGTSASPWFSTLTSTSTPNHIANTTWFSTIDPDPPAIELTSSTWPSYFSDPGRTLADYAALLGHNPGASEDLIEVMRTRGPQEWDPAYSADAIIDYIREGFDRAPVGVRLGPPNCSELSANSLTSFGAQQSPIPKMADSSFAACGMNRASIAHSDTYYARVGVTSDSTQLWYAYNTNSAAIFRTVSSGRLATTPCISAGLNNNFVAVWYEYDPATGLSNLHGARLTGSTPSVFQLYQGLDVSPHEHKHTAGGSLVQHGAHDWVVPPSVACMEDGSFVVSYSTGGERRIATYSSASTPSLIQDILMDTGFPEYNHCVAAKGASMTDTSGRVAFVAMIKPAVTGQTYGLQPYVRSYAPAFHVSCKPGRLHAIPLPSQNTMDLSLGPAFAHPIAFRPDGKLVVTWFTQIIDPDTQNNPPGPSTVHGTDLGFSVMDLAGVAYCPADLNCDGKVDSADETMFTTLYGLGDLRADFNCNGQIDSGDITAYQAAHQQGCK